MLALRRTSALALVVASLFAASVAAAQGQPPPQQYPPQQYPPQQYPPQQYPPQQYPPQQYPPQQYPPQQYPPQQYPPQQYPPQQYPPQQPDPRQAPAPYEPQEVEVPTHAPKFSLWVGPRVSYLGFGGSFFVNELGRRETTGNFSGNGVGFQLDVGARISKRYIPYVFIEHSFMGQGHRFEGTDAKTTTTFYGLGFRYVAGDVDSVGFLTDLSIGLRNINVTNGSESYTMSALEIFKLGLGAEIRVATLFSITPLASLSGGVMSDTKGTINYMPGHGDGLTRPTYHNGETIDNQAPYVVLSLGVGGHFDVFGQ